ncbi:MAG: hypothetical protein U5K54_21555 [Cytophagales bacterium]|nr:hypothetical protein [Cytophagales bacterium]
MADDRCFAVKADTVTVNVAIKDIDGSDTEFLPPNVFTPNGDGCNDYFALEGISPCSFNSDPNQNPDQQISLPLDNCINRFESVKFIIAGAEKFLKVLNETSAGMPRMR